MANTIGTLAISVRANVDKAVKEFKKTGKEVGKLKKTITSAKVAFSGLTIAAAGAGVAFEKLRREIVQSMRDIDSLAKTASKLGTTTEALGGLQLAAELSGISIGQMETAIQRMVRRVAEAAKGTGEAKDALAELNVDAQRLIALSPDRQLYEIADAFQAVNSQSDRVRLAFKLFDTEGVALVNTLAGGSEALKQIRRDAQGLGFLITERDVRRIEQANDAITRLNFATRALFNEIAIEIAPELESFFNRATKKLAEFNSQVQDGSSFLGDLSERVKGVGDSFETGVTGAMKLNDAITLVFNSLRLAGDAAPNAFRAVARRMQADFHQIGADYFGGRKTFSASDQAFLDATLARDAERLGFTENVVNSFNRIFGTGPNPVSFTDTAQAFDDYVANQKSAKIATEQAAMAQERLNDALLEQIYLANDEAVAKKQLKEAMRLRDIEAVVKQVDQAYSSIAFSERQLLEANLKVLQASPKVIAEVLETFDAAQALLDDKMPKSEVNRTLEEMDDLANRLRDSLKGPVDRFEDFLGLLVQVEGRLTDIEKNKLISNKFDELFGDTFKPEKIATAQSPAALQRGTAAARSAEVQALNRLNNGQDDKRYQEKMVKLSERSRDYLREIARDISDIERDGLIEIVESL